MPSWYRPTAWYRGERRQWGLGKSQTVLASPVPPRATPQLSWNWRGKSDLAVNFREESQTAAITLVSSSPASQPHPTPAVTPSRSSPTTQLASQPHAHSPPGGRRARSVPRGELHTLQQHQHHLWPQQGDSQSHDRHMPYNPNNPTNPNNFNNPIVLITLITLMTLMILITLLTLIT
jgi:hypothetical protein